MSDHSYLSRAAKSSDSKRSPGISMPERTKVARVLQAPGQQLDSASRAYWEPQFAHDFSRVRVHTDAQAAEAAEALNSRAFTVGRHITFSRGLWAPRTEVGQRLLAHELSHVVQQEAAHDANPEALSVSSTADPGERCAEDISSGVQPAWRVSSQPALRLNVVQIQRAPAGEHEGEDDPAARSRQSRPRNAPSGTRPIDESGLDRGTIHGIKDAIGAGPKDWVGVTPEGEVITTGADGDAENHGPVTDYARRGSENIPKWVWAVIGFAAMIALIVLFVTGVGEVGLILAGAGAAVLFVVRSALKAAGREPQPVATSGGGAKPKDSASA
jgi:hypothetical protein